VRLTSGDQRRDFTYVEDVADALLRLGRTATGPGEVVNVATGHLLTVRRFAEVAARVLGLADGQLVFGALPTRAEEMEHDPVNVSRLAVLTGWTPPTSVEDGIRRTVRAGAAPAMARAGL
jgi:nucleoside-diphosphate-sugar epimerase